LLWVADPPTAEPYVRALKEGLRERGWIEGKTIRIVERYDYYDSARRPKLATELVALEVDLLYVLGISLPAARKATQTIPMVCPDFFDPIKEGFTTSLARPDGNVTGISWQTTDLAIKRLELTRDLVGRMRRIAWLYDATDPGAAIELRGAVAAAHAGGVEVQELGYRTAGELEAQLSKLKRGRLDALIVSTSPSIWPAIDRIVALASADRIPVITEPVEFARAGAIISYGVDILQEFRRSAYFVDRILKGATPTELPIEQATHFQLGVNLKTAKMLKLEIPVTIMNQATEVIR
jgi:putative ABC transport system substrate-binding protein